MAIPRGIMITALLASLLCPVSAQAVESITKPNELYDNIFERQRIFKTLGLTGFSSREASERRKLLTKRYSAPHFMMKLFQELENEALPESNLHINSSKTDYYTERKYLEETKVDTVISFFKYEHDNSWRKSHSDIKIKFNTKINSEKKHVEGGEFKVYKRLPRTSKMTGMLCNVSVYKILEGNGTLLLETRAVHTWRTGWMSFNVTQALKEWIRFPLGNHGLQLVARNSRGLVINPHHFGIVSERGNKEKLPYLVSFVNTARLFPTFSQEILSTRHRRSMDNLFEQSPRKACRLKKFYVDFRQIGLHTTIIAPPGYNAYFCKGGCMFPIDVNRNTTSHAILQTLSHLLHNDVPNPCCTPNSLRPLSILYFDNDNNIVMKKHPGMVVTSCACQ